MLKIDNGYPRHRHISVAGTSVTLLGAQVGESAAEATDWSGHVVKFHSSIKVLSKGYYRKIRWVVSGGAPKGFICVICGLSCGPL